MYKRFRPSRRRFMQGMAGLVAAAATWPLRRAFAGPAAAARGVDVHLVVMTVVDKDHTWRAEARVGDDATVAAKYVHFTDANGNRHRGLTAWFYADCVEAGATALDNAYDYINFKSVTVTYDGAKVTVPPSSKKDGTYDFWRGCRCPAIRYGRQVGWNADKIDWSLLPSWPRDQRQAPFDDSKMNYSFNGLGCGSLPGMGSGGSRPDIGYLPVWDLAFVTNPSDETWAVARRAADHEGVWGMVFTSDPETGGIADQYKFPILSTSPAAQGGSWAKNSIVRYGGSYDGDTLIPPERGVVTGALGRPSASHLTGYALLAAMITGTARDGDHASFWSNYPILEVSNRYTQRGMLVLGPQRLFAWVFRNMFVASYVSSNTEYFAAEVARNLSIVTAHATNPVGAYDVRRTYPRAPIANGGQVAIAPWMQYYLCTVMDAMQIKLPAWRPFARFLAKFMVNWVTHPFTACAGLGSFVVWQTDADGKTQSVMDDFPEQTRRSLLNFKYTTEQAEAVVSATTVAVCYSALRAAKAGGGGGQAGTPWTGKCEREVSDFIGYVGAPDDYGAMARAALVCAYNSGALGAEKCLAYWRGIPTKPDFSHNFIFNLVPRTT